MNHRLLILGTLGEFVQLVQKAKQKGYYTIVCDGYPNGEARAYADASYVLPVTDTDSEPVVLFYPVRRTNLPVFLHNQVSEVQAPRVSDGTRICHDTTEAAPVSDSTEDLLSPQF